MQFCLFSLKHVSDDFSARSIVRLELGIASISCVAFAICHLLTKVGIGACEDPLQAVVVHVRITRPIEPRQPSSHIAGLYLMTMMYREYHNPNPNPTDTGTYQCIKDNPRNRRYSDKISPYGFLYISRSRSRSRKWECFIRPEFRQSRQERRQNEHSPQTQTVGKQAVIVVLKSNLDQSASIRLLIHHLIHHPIQLLIHYFVHHIIKHHHRHPIKNIRTKSVCRPAGSISPSTGTALRIFFGDLGKGKRALA